jgi:signal transduction histidine kinase
VRIEVTDSGEGIEKDKLHLIFERYYRISGSHKRAAHGTGLGLSIVSRVITAMGGRYGVRSAIGHGSTFWFELPVSK